MEMSTLIIIIAALAVLCLIFPTKIGVFLRGIYNMFFEDISKTPEGAEIVYNEALNEKKTLYTKASDVLNTVGGKLKGAKERLADHERRLSAVELKCEMAAKAKQEENLRLFAQQRKDVLEDIALEKKAINELEPMYKDATEACTLLQNSIRDLEREKTRVVNELKLHGDLKKVYAGFDSLRNDSKIQELLNAAREGNKETKEESWGAKDVHENRMETKIAKAEASAADAQVDDYISSLRDKFKA